MKNSIETHEHFTIIKLQGRIDIGNGDVQLRNIISDVARSGTEAIILDFKKVSYMDSSGVGELISQYTEVQTMGKCMFLANLNAKIYDLMTLTQLITVLPIYDSIEDAKMALTAAA
ncbi:STAS domain-containing protein [Acanthopleuribacter pedis]|uniref:Anti-sigma factor antagonist n=1 Tax=Acanthopleuribacter pedis TaxID=442870 RepID=A0A8J7U4U2_9BACT|nr:STAS domain-containing protein [Acanthopleuribacter pedis]MBO1320144.1 STAS domain-containing protein [Acanthopleuribacter pedis]